MPATGTTLSTAAMLSFSTRLSWITDFTELFKLTDRFYMLWLLSPEF